MKKPLRCFNAVFRDTITLLLGRVKPVGFHKPQPDDHTTACNILDRVKTSMVVVPGVAMKKRPSPDVRYVTSAVEYATTSWRHLAGRKWRVASKMKVFALLSWESFCKTLYLEILHSCDQPVSLQTGPKQPTEIEKILWSRARIVSRTKFCSWL